MMESSLSNKIDSPSAYIVPLSQNVANNNNNNTTKTQDFMNSLDDFLGPQTSTTTKEENEKKSKILSMFNNEQASDTKQ